MFGDMEKIFPNIAFNLKTKYPCLGTLTYYYSGMWRDCLLLQSKNTHHFLCQVIWVFKYEMPRYLPSYTCFVWDTCLSPVNLEVYRVEAIKCGLASILQQVSWKLNQCHPRACETWAVGWITNNEVLANSHFLCTKALLTLM